MEPLDIWRSAREMVKQHGELAPIQCAMKADTMLERGDLDGQMVWLAIRRAAKALLVSGPPNDIEPIDPAQLPRSMEGGGLHIVRSYTEAGQFGEANVVRITDGVRTALYAPFRIVRASEAD